MEQFLETSKTLKSLQLRVRKKHLIRKKLQPSLLVAKLALTAVNLLAHWQVS